MSVLLASVKWITKLIGKRSANARARYHRGLIQNEAVSRCLTSARKRNSGVPNVNVPDVVVWFYNAEMNVRSDREKKARDLRWHW